MSAPSIPVTPAATEHAAPLFSIDQLTVDFLTPRGPVRAVDGISLAVSPGRTLGIVGESGSGKTVSTLAALGLLPGRTPIEVGGRAIFDGDDLLAMPAKRRRRYLGRDIGVIFQDPISALDPVQRIGTQIVEALRLHDRTLSSRAATARAVELLTEVGVPDPTSRIRAYPHQFSGGMCQRVVIAIAMANRPRLLIADEPTTAVDATVQAQLLDLLKSLQSETGTAIVLITHDLSVVSQVADDVCLMYAGKIVEQRDTRTFIQGPSHPYGIGLLASRPGAALAGTRLTMIEGGLPDPTDMPTGCRFRPRCSRGVGHDICSEREPQLGPDQVACHFPGPTTAAPSAAPGRDTTAAPSKRPITVAEADRSPAFVETTAQDGHSGALVRARGLTKQFPIRSSVLHRPVGRIAAVDGIDLDLAAGETLGLVGESGCGKSTTGRLLLRLIEPTGGTIELRDTDLTALDPGDLRRTRAQMQMVFQDPLGSLNPRLSAAENISDPLRAHAVPAEERKARVADLLEQVGLRPDAGSRLPTEFSGGQRQRIGIARALSVRPDFVVLDEPVASLDVSVQAQIINLLADLQKQYHTGYLFISHDLAVVQHISTRTAVMYLGRIVEIGSTDALFDRPAHPYTAALLSAAPRLDDNGRRERIILPGEPPSPAQHFTGCRFRARCLRATDICANVDPPLQPVIGSNRQVACHHPDVPTRESA